MQDGDAGRIVFKNIAGQHTRRHLADGAGHLRGDLRDGHVDLDVGVEVDPNHGDAVVGLRFDVFDVVDVGGEAALKIRNDALFHLLRGKTRVLPEHADDGDVNIGENIHRHGDDGGHAQEGDENGHDHEGIRAAEG